MQDGVCLGERYMNGCRYVLGSCALQAAERTEVSKQSVCAHFAHMGETLKA